jgi:hypothetical protein
MADLEARKGSTVHAETVSVETATPGKDKAAILLEQAGRDITVTAADNKRVLRQIDWAILPIILFIYCLQSLDKSSLSYASVFGLIPDLNLVGSQFSWAGAIVYVAQLVWQPLIAYILVKFPIGKFMAVMVLCWGATLCGMVAARDFGGLMAARFMLGTFEASVAPTFVAIVQMWYRRSEQTNRNAAWYSMLGVVNIVSFPGLALHRKYANTTPTARKLIELRSCQNPIKRAPPMADHLPLLRSPYRDLLHFGLHLPPRLAHESTLPQRRR